MQTEQIDMDGPGNVRLSTAQRADTALLYPVGGMRILAMQLPLEFDAGLASHIVHD